MYVSITRVSYLSQLRFINVLQHEESDSMSFPYIF